MTKKERERIYRKEAELIFYSNKRGEVMLCWEPIRYNFIRGNFKGTFSYEIFPEIRLVDSSAISEGWSDFDPARILGTLFAAEMCKD